MMGHDFYYPPKNKLFVARYVEFFESSLISQEASESTTEFYEIQREDTLPSDKTRKHQTEVEHQNVIPHHDEIPICRSAWIPQAPERYGFYVDSEEHRTVGSKWIFKKKTDMDGNAHTYKAHLVVKGYTQTYGLYYEVTFSPIVDIKAIRILMIVAAFYDYENQDAFKPEEVRCMQRVPYASADRIYHVCSKNILKYLRNTKDIFLVYGGDIESELRVTSYTDVGVETDHDDTRSQT
ncbi:retrotransposon protein, putative, ty1-copia subclass [Tanacetum coccineum]|uniref:Retrotransposon protein, putative, ty1-copia subclass n=1 Tax=Tanacetum coccineum TaxID=301880 RepID=A0ABQ5IM63_9ASTR